MPELTAEDIQKIVRDSVSAETAKFIEEQRALSIERGKKIEDEAKKPGLKKARDFGLETDPYKGKGLDFARCLKAMAMHRRGMGDSVESVLKGWGYRDQADQFEAQRKAVAMSEGIFADGGALVPEVFSAEIIELLRARTVVRGSGVRSVPLTNGNLTLGRQNAAATAAYSGENANIAVSKPGFDEINLAAKKLTALVPMSNDLIRDASAAAEMLVRDDLLKVMGLREDLAFIRGDGTAYTPKGLRYLLAAANVFAATGGASPTVAQIVADLTKMIRLVEESDAPMTKCGWLQVPRSYWKLFALLDANSNFVFRDELKGGTLFGYPFKKTTQIPKNLGGGSDETEIYFQEFDEAIIGDALGIQVEAFPGGAYHDGGAVVSGISQDQTVLRAIARHDFAVRHTNTGSVLTGVQW